MKRSQDLISQLKEVGTLGSLLRNSIFIMENGSLKPLGNGEREEQLINYCLLLYRAYKAQAWSAGK